MTSREKFEAFLVSEYEWGNDALNAANFHGDDATGYYTGGDFIYDGQSCSECLFWAWRGWQAAELAAEKKLTDMAVQLANAESKCRELAAENSEVKVAAILLADEAAQIYKRWNLTQQPDGDIVDMQTIQEMLCACHETPATDAFLAEVRASARDNFIDRIEWIIRNECNPDKTEAIISELQKFSGELKQEASQ
ncbi:TPA: hypothetical protein ACQ431_004083 [Citrobacter murliniae]